MNRILLALLIAGFALVVDGCSAANDAAAARAVRQMNEHGGPN